MADYHRPETEAWLSYLWQARLLPDPLRSVDGKTIAVITPGLLNADRGPDFRGALLLINGSELLQGDVEVHRVAADWQAHGHATDPHYQRVILHLVGQPGSGAAARCCDGPPILEAAVPVELLAPEGWERPEYRKGAERPCDGLAQRIGRDTLGRGLAELGRLRFTEKDGRFRTELGEAEPDQVLYRALLEGLGYGRNQEAYLALADRLNWADLQAIAGNESDPAAAFSAALLDAAGFVPGAAPPLPWDRFRLLPAARPERRLQAFGHLSPRSSRVARCVATAPPSRTAPETRRSWWRSSRCPDAQVMAALRLRSGQVSDGTGQCSWRSTAYCPSCWLGQSCRVMPVWPSRRRDFSRACRRRVTA